MGYARKIVLQLPLSDLNVLPEFVDACLRDGVDLIAICGPGSDMVEDFIDQIVVGDGSDETRFIATTSHSDESLEDVMNLARLWHVEDGTQNVQLVNL